MPLHSWRILLPRLAESPMDLDEELFQAMLALERKRLQQSVRWDEMSSWSVNQDAGSLTVFFDDEMEVKSEIQIIGSFDSDTFKWAWSNPSVRDELKKDSLRIREYGVKHGWSIFSETTFAATRRDGYAVMALAAELFDSDMALAIESFNSDGAGAVNSGDIVTYVTLSELPEFAKPSAKQPEFETLSLVDSLTGSLLAQIGSVQLSLNDLREVENICRRGYVQGQSGQYPDAVQSFDEAWEKLGEFATDQEPASWIKLAKGDALFLDGKMEEALATLIEADELYGCPDPALLYQRMGQCYLALGHKERATDMFARVYVAKGAEGLAQLSIEERDLFTEDLKTRRKQASMTIAACKIKQGEDKQLDQAAATISCLIRELNSFELDAHKQQEKARKCREIDTQLCAEDAEAREKINSQWTWLMAIWCTPLRSPCCNTFQYPPAHDPKNEKLERIWRTRDGWIKVQTTADDSFGHTNNWRYELEEVNGSLLISQIYSVWDDEEFSSI